ncbi:hypothetical protein N320_00885, partial [Buceros rhinoceros silvestris]
KQCSFFFLCFNSTTEMTTFVIVLMKYLCISFILYKKKSDINPVQLQRYIYKTFCKKKSSAELTYLNTP